MKDRQRQPRGRAKSKTVLLVDDDENARIPFDLILERTNCRVVQEVDPVHALKVLKGHRRVDMLFVDLYMPGMSGLDFLSRLKEEELAIPVVMVSAEDKAYPAAEAIRRGSADYLTKPVSKERVQDCLSRLLPGFERWEGA